MASDFAKPAAGDHFIVEDLLDFSHHHDGAFDGLTAANSNSADTSSSSVDVTPPDSCNSSFSGNNDFNFPPAGDFSFSGDLCVPQDDLAELEWLSNFVEESFSSDDHQKLCFTSGVSAFKTRPEIHSETHFYHHADLGRSVNAQSRIFNPEMPVPGKARSKRSRAAPGNWSSRLVLLSSTARPNPSEPVQGVLKNEGGNGPIELDPTSGEIRKCLHCGTVQTPQWRAGPMGPKTLCNACGVRYKSGRLVPEYRPASSPTFVQTKHSNSHRKVMELRRQKDLLRQQQLQQQQYNHHHQQRQLIHHSNNMVFNSSNSDDYLIHQQIGSDFRQII